MAVNEPRHGPRHENIPHGAHVVAHKERPVLLLVNEGELLEHIEQIRVREQPAHLPKQVPVRLAGQHRRILLRAVAGRRHEEKPRPGLDLPEFRDYPPQIPREIPPVFLRLVREDLVHRAELASVGEQIVDPQGDDVGLTRRRRAEKAHLIRPAVPEFPGGHAVPGHVRHSDPVHPSEIRAPGVFAHIVESRRAVGCPGLEFARGQAVAHHRESAEYGGKGPLGDRPQRAAERFFIIVSVIHQYASTSAMYSAP